MRRYRMRGPDGESWQENKWDSEMVAIRGARTERVKPESKQQLTCLWGVCKNNRAHLRNGPAQRPPVKTTLPTYLSIKSGSPCLEALRVWMNSLAQCFPGDLESLQNLYTLIRGAQNRGVSESPSVETAGAMVPDWVALCM